MRGLATALLAAVSACGGPSNTSSTASSAAATRAVLTISDAHGSPLLRFSVQIAATEQTRNRGLAGVTHLSDRDGMVFQFPAITDSGFWMKDTVIPLDIAFWRSDGVIVDIKEMQPCTKDPCPLYKSRQPYIASVEVAGGLLERSHVQLGDHVALSP